MLNYLLRYNFLYKYYLFFLYFIFNMKSVYSQTYSSWVCRWCYISLRVILNEALFTVWIIFQIHHMEKHHGHRLQIHKVRVSRFFVKKHRGSLKFSLSIAYTYISIYGIMTQIIFVNVIKILLYNYISLS